MIRFIVKWSNIHATVFGLLNNIIIASTEICCEFNPLIIIIVMFIHLFT